MRAIMADWPNYSVSPLWAELPQVARSLLMGERRRAGLMRFFERCSVFVNRAGSGMHIPRHAGSFAVLVLLGGVACFGMVLGGHTAETLKLAGTGVGLGVDKVLMSGNKRVSEIDVLQALGLDGEISLPMLNIDEAQERLQSLPWVARASVRKIYPDKLSVSIIEREPFAVWQDNGKVNIVDAQGHIIVPYNRADGRGLPFFVGQGAAENAQSFLAGMKAFPDLESHARAYIRVADRRWDILLDNGLRIKLPENRPFQRLAAAEAMDKSQGLFNRDVTDLDLRMPDRIVVALAPDAMERWQQTVAQAQTREKALKAGIYSSPPKSVPAQNAGAQNKRGQQA